MTTTASTQPTTDAPSPLQRATPVLFVMVWSTGFIGAKLGLPFVGPLTFLLMRFGICIAAMLLVALATGAVWPRRPAMVLHLAIVGLLLQFTYLVGVYVGIAWGVPAGVSALIVGFQPILTAALAGVTLGERILPRQWLGLGLGLIGVALVVADKSMLDWTRLEGVGFTVIAMIGITLGTIYQKLYCTGVDLRAALVIQNATAGLVMLPTAFLFEPMTVHWTGQFVFALLWLAIVLSVGATMLLLYLIRHGAASRVSSLFYLTPAVTAVTAFLLFGETLTPLALVGMAIAAAGVWTVNAAR
jgi:drug/metabolite transporter (DMT)-like permease